MTHHVMNQMGHQFGNLIGINSKGMSEKVRKLVPGYMIMGDMGMGDMGNMGMPVPKNSIPMVGGDGQFGYITMGGMFTVFKVREGINSYEDPGWYKYPEGTVADVASDKDLKRDGIET
jgi:hypothetical protein